MSKSAKKKKKADFQKVKLKVGRKIKKGNETLPQVKVGRVVIRSQFKAQRELVKTLSGKTIRHTLTELIKRCSNCNATIRHEAVTSLTQVFQSYSGDGATQDSNTATSSNLPDATGHLSLEAVLNATEIIRTVLCALFVDKDAVVRQDARKLLRTMLKAMATHQNNISDLKTPNNQNSTDEKNDENSGNKNAVSTNSTPDSNLNQTVRIDHNTHMVLVLGVCRAMSHLEESIQIDSLHILDILMDFCPELVSASSYRFLSDFLSIISRQHLIGRAGTGGGGTSVNAGGVSSRVLCINPNSKLATQKWRVKVLERVGRLMEIVGAEGKRAECDNNNDDCSWWFSSDSSQLSHSDSSAVSEVRSSCPIISLLDSHAHIRNVISTLIPLLLDCWIEAEVNTTHKTTSSQQGAAALDENSVSIIQNIVSVILLLFQILVEQSDQPSVECDWLSEKFEKKFMQHFMSGFPHQIRVKKSKRGSESSNNNDIGNQFEVNTTVNLGLARIMVYLLDDKPLVMSHSNSLNNLKHMTYLHRFLERTQKMKTKRENLSRGVWLEDVVEYVVHLLVQQQPQQRQQQEQRGATKPQQQLQPKKQRGQKRKAGQQVQQQQPPEQQLLEEGKQARVRLRLLKIEQLNTVIELITVCLNRQLDTDTHRRLLEAFFTSYHTCQQYNAVTLAQCWLKFFMDTFLRNHFKRQYFESFSSVSEWESSLPDLLVKSAGSVPSLATGSVPSPAPLSLDLIIDCIELVARQGCQSFLESLTGRRQDLLDSASNLSNLSSIQQQRLAQCFKYCALFDK